MEWEIHSSLPFDIYRKIERETGVME